MITSKTSCEHATANVDDERGRNFIGQEAGMNRPDNLAQLHCGYLSL